MDPIKDAFTRVREDIDSLRLEVHQVRKSLIELCEIMQQMSRKEQENKHQTQQNMQNTQGKEQNSLRNEQNNQQINQYSYPNYPAHNPQFQTNQQIIPAHYMPFKPLNPQNQPFSTGNEGVPADRQTNQQTDKHIENTSNIGKNSIENAAEMLKSLDNIKKDIRQKFKKLTEQEWLVFSTIYQLDEEDGHSDYRVLSERLKLTESSIRDYVARLIKKGIPVDKIKLNNKNVQLNISKSLKQIASISTIITLRDL